MTMSRIKGIKGKKELNKFVPRNHLVRKIERCINLEFIEKSVEKLYSNIGKPSIPQ